MIWLFHFISISALALMSRSLSSPKFFLSGVFLYSIFVFGQRWMTGEDFPGYLLYYLYQFGGSEGGFSIFFWVQNLFAQSGIYFGWFILLVYTITLNNTIHVIKSVGKNQVIILFLFVFFEMYFIQMSQIRQQLAISFFIIGYLHSFQKEYGRASLYYLIASSIHISALLAIPLTFIRYKQFSRGLGLLIFFASLVLPLVQVQVFIPNFLLGSYVDYLGGQYDQPLNLLHLIRYYAIVLFVLFLIMRSNLKTSNQAERMMITGFVIYVVAYGLSFQFAPFLRVSYFFKIFEVICLGYFITRSNESLRDLVQVAMYALTIGIYTSVAVLDPYNISRYQFRLLQLQEDRSVQELRGEIDRFYYEDRIP